MELIGVGPKEKLLAPSPDQYPRQFGLVSFGQQSTWVKENSITNQVRQGPSVWKDSLSSGGNANEEELMATAL